MQHNRIPALYALNVLSLQVTRDLFSSTVSTIPELLAIAATIKATVPPHEQAVIDTMTQEVLLAVLQGVETTTSWLSALLEAALHEATSAEQAHTNGRDSQDTGLN